MGSFETALEGKTDATTGQEEELHRLVDPTYSCKQGFSRKFLNTA